MGGPMSPSTAASYSLRKGAPRSPDDNGYAQGQGQQYYDYNDQQEHGYPVEEYSLRDDDVGARVEEGFNGYHCDEPETEGYEQDVNMSGGEEPRSTDGISPKDLEATLLELVDHKKALLRRLQDARAARKNS